MGINKTLINIIWIAAFAVALVFIGVSTFGLYTYHKSNLNQDLNVDINQRYLVLNNELLQSELHSVDSIKKTYLEIKFLDSAKVKLNQSIRIIDSINRYNQKILVNKVDSLNVMIDRYNDRVSQLTEIEGDYTYKANFFYSIIIFIITLFAFFGYRNFNK